MLLRMRYRERGRQCQHERLETNTAVGLGNQEAIGDYIFLFCLFFVWSLVIFKNAISREF